MTQFSQSIDPKSRAAQPGRQSPGRDTLALIAGLALAALTAFGAFYLAGSRSPFGLAAVVIDLILGGYICLCLLYLQRRQVLGFILVAPVLIVIQIGAIAKSTILQSGIQITDILLIDDLVVHYVSSVWQAVVVIGIASVPLLLFLRNARVPRGREILMLVPAIAYLAVIFGRLYLGVAMAAVVPSVNQSYHAQREVLIQGHLYTLLFSALSYAEREDRYRRLAEMERSDFGFIGQPLKSAPRRNVHILALESLIDPASIPGISLDPDPFSPMFVAWRESDGPRAVQPVFGGRSPDGLFEIFCGLPATLDDGQVLFPQLVDDKIDCLPNKLRSLGYETQSWIPVPPEEFEYDTAYRRLGFSTRYFRHDVDMNDMDGEVLAAQSLLEQNLQYVKTQLGQGKPLLNHVFVTAGHFPFFLDQAKRPHRVTVTPHSDFLKDYVNCAYYTTRAVEAYIEQLRQLDPTAIIVAVGDHPPGFPVVPDGVTYPRPVDTRYDVPLLIFDGERGRIPLSGQIMGYQVPQLISDLLTDGAFCRENECGYKNEVSTRPLPRNLLVFDRKTKQVTSCAADPNGPHCAEVRQFADRARLAVFNLIGFK